MLFSDLMFACFFLEVLGALFSFQVQTGVLCHDWLVDNHIAGAVAAGHVAVAPGILGHSYSLGSVPA